MKNDIHKTPVDLRQQAEDTAALSPESREPLSPDAARLMLHELHVHQIELEMQNEELRRTQSELLAARALYFNLYDLAPMGYVTLSEAGMILEINLTATTLLGIIRNTLSLHPFSHYVSNEDKDAFYLFRRHLLETGEPQEVELRMLKSDGALFWARLSATVALDVEGVSTCRIAFIDITSHKETEEKLAESHQDWVDTFDCITDMVTVHDKNFNILLANKAARQFFGLQILGKGTGTKCFRYCHGTDQPPRACLACTCISSEQPTTSEFFEPYLKRYLEVSCSPKFGPNHEVVGLIHVVRDITERKHTEAELGKLDKLQSVGTLAGGIAHDFNNIMQGLYGNIALAKEDLPQGHPSYAFLVDAERSMTRAVRLTKQLLTFAKGGHPSRRTFDWGTSLKRLRTSISRVATFA